MEASLLGLYLKVNLLLAAALLLWLATRRLAPYLGFESSHATQLTIARLLFGALLGMAGLALFAHGWLTAVATRMTDGMTVVAGIDTSLSRSHDVGFVAVETQTLVLTLLLIGCAWQAVRLARQVGKLRRIVTGAIEWRRIGSIHLLVSNVVATPFSTRALGARHIVLPMTLLESPRNLRLAVKHELQHVRNGDLEWVILLEAVKALCFWNPAAWLWHNEFDCLQEFACDEALIEQRKVAPLAYGNCLLEVASSHRGNALLAASNMVPKFSWWRDTQSQLKQRVILLTTARGTRNQLARSLGYLLLAGTGMTHTALVVFAADEGAASEAIPRVRVNPDYPRAALMAGMESWVQLEFTIDENGNVRNPLVLDNCVWPNGEDPDTCKKDDLFNSSALEAVSRWRYAPRVENGVALPRHGVQTIIRYTLEDDADDSQPADAAAATPRGCLYAGTWYATGAVKQTERVVNEGGNVKLVADPYGPLMTCIEDSGLREGFRWQVAQR